MRLPFPRHAAAAILASVAAAVPVVADFPSLVQTEEDIEISGSEKETSANDSTKPEGEAKPAAMSKVSDALRRNISNDRLLPKLSRRSNGGSASTVEAEKSAATSNGKTDNSTNMEDMVPITRELLREHYAKFPNPDINPVLLQQRIILEEVHSRLMTGVPEDAVIKRGESVGQSSHEIMSTILNEALPAGLDNAMYTARCACEEAARRCADVAELRDLEGRLHGIAGKYETFQVGQREHVSEVINGFLPQDFRGSLFTILRQRSERSNVQAIAELMANGGTVRQKYAMMWEQQWKRRENLAMIGNATGIWRWVVRYLGGVPVPLLSFAKNINTPQGPTEALRMKFGSALAELSKFAIHINALCSAIAFSEHVEDKKEFEALLVDSLNLYDQEVSRFVQLLQEVIVKSPFFVRPDQIASLKPLAR